MPMLIFSKKLNFFDLTNNLIRNVYSSHFGVRVLTSSAHWKCFIIRLLGRSLWRTYVCYDRRRIDLYHQQSFSIYVCLINSKWFIIKKIFIRKTFRGTERGVKKVVSSQEMLYYQEDVYKEVILAMTQEQYIYIINSFILHMYCVINKKSFV